MIINLSLFSPRWGHEDTYSVEILRDTLTISMNARVAKATWQENQDPQWDGEPLERTMTNDHIHPPADIQDFFEYVWREWRNGNINDATADVELHQLEQWINSITSAKPRSEFWRRYF